MLMAFIKRAAGFPLYWVLLTIFRWIGFGRVVPTGKVFVFKPDRIGDFVLACGAIRFLCRQYGAGEVTLLVSSLVRPLAEREFPGCRILTVHLPLSRDGDHWRKVLWKRWQNVRRSNHRRGYEKMVNLRHHPTLLDDLLLGSFRSRDSYGATLAPLGGRHWKRRLRTFVPRYAVKYPNNLPVELECLELEAHRQVVQLLAGRAVTAAEIRPRLEMVATADDGFLLVTPHGSDPLRDYPPASLAQGIQAGGIPSHAPIILCGEPARSEELQALADLLRVRVPNPVRVVHPQGLLEFVDYVARAHCVISAESAAAHITTAMDKRGIFILGGGHFGFFAPWRRSTLQTWLQLPMSCYGCDWHCIHPEVKCIRDLPPSFLAEALALQWHHREN